MAKITEKQKQQMILRLKAKTGFSIPKCKSLLEQADWIMDKADPVTVAYDDNQGPQYDIIKHEPAPAKQEPKQPKHKSKKKPKQEVQTQNKQPDDKTDTDKPRNDFDDYIKRCTDQHKHKSHIPDMSCVPKGFNTMYEIVKFAQQQGFKIQQPK